MTFGLVIGNRGFFPTALCEKGRARMLGALEAAGHKAIVLGEDTSLFGSVETLAEARLCADLFAANRDDIDGIIVTLPNFGDEKAVANAIRWSGLNVPVLIHAFPDDVEAMTITHRRDSFCGKISVCNNLKQYGIPFTLTANHVDEPENDSFVADLEDFAATCRVVKSMRGLRIGAIGARPAAFNTVRYSEKLLERSGISVETLDLFELFGWVDKLADDDPIVAAKLAEIEDYAETSGVDQAPILRMAKMGAVIDRWMKDQALDATAIQCWTAMEEFFGITPCTCMSMMSNELRASACEVDVAGTVSMMALAAASGTPSALLDWNNNYGSNPDKGVAFHCSNLPKDVFGCGSCGKPTMGYQEILAGTVGKDNAYGSLEGRMREAPLTYCRVTTDDLNGTIKGYVGEGRMTADPLKTFGGYGVFEIPKLQKLLHYVCNNGFEHHVAFNLSQVAKPVHEALSNYLGWDMEQFEG
jgi:L-fucose isomerase-like protein